MGLREAIIIAVLCLFIVGLIWMLKKPQTKIKFYVATALLILGAVNIIIGFIQHQPPVLENGFKLCVFWGGVSVLTSTTERWRRIAGWSMFVLGFLLFGART